MQIKRLRNTFWNQENQPRGNRLGAVRTGQRLGCL